MYAIERNTDLLVFEVCYSRRLIHSLYLRVDSFRVIALAADFEVDIRRDLDLDVMNRDQQFLFDI